MTNQKKNRTKLKFAISIFTILFGIATIKQGGAVALFNDEARRSAGNYVPFVVWFNFVVGFAYVIAGVQLLRGKKGVHKLASMIAVATLLVFAAFGAWVMIGHPFEIRTIAAMTFRSVFWVIFAVIVNPRYFESK